MIKHLVSMCEALGSSPADGIAFSSGKVAGCRGSASCVCASRVTALSHPLPVLQTSKRVGKVLHTSLQSILHKEESLGPKRQKVGFLG